VWDIRVLGPLEATRAGQPVDLGSPKQRLVLSILICQAGQLVSTDSLIDARAHPVIRKIGCTVIDSSGHARVTSAAQGR
jgi:hypothetical protein